MNRNQTSILSNLVLLVLLLAFSTSLLNAQEVKNQITISGIATHYDEIQKSSRAKYFNGYYLYPVDPGIEILYSRKLFKDFFIATGLSFQQGRIATLIDSKRRFQSKELSVPVFITFSPKISNKSGLLFTSGLYGGKLIRVKAEDPGKTEVWHEIPKSAVEKFSDDDLFVDIYFSAGYYQTFSKIGKLSLNPYIKFRSNTTWLNYYERRIHYGIKLSYIIGL